MAGPGVNDLLAWFDRESDGAPAPLRERALGYLASGPPGGDVPEALAAAATRALATTLAHPGGRGAALDLLAADALVTLALKAKAASDPAALGRFAERLRLAGAGTP